MKEKERLVAGLYCSQVLAMLNDYLDGELTSEDKGRVDAHLAGCDWCERFGAGMAAVVKEVKRLGQAPEPESEAIRARLLRKLELA
jgi:anti-sigma factor RsiW